MSKPTAPNLKFSHMGISCSDVHRMKTFYTEVLGFTVTDTGHAEGMDLIFLSRDPNDHHQIVLAGGKPDNMPANTAHPQFGPSINQISFLVGGIDDLRDIYGRLEKGGATNLFPANHGIAWSIYCHDPEGNNLEFFTDTEWYFPQPFLVPLDLSQSDEEIYNLTKEHATQQEGYMPYGEWRAKIATKMTQFKAPASAD